MIQDIGELSIFLHSWYRANDADFSVPRPVFPVAPIPSTLRRFHECLGKLTNPREYSLDSYHTPLGAQDGIHPQHFVRRTGDGAMIVFASENQENWTATYRVDDAADDPQVWSDFANDGTHGHQPLAQNMEAFLITIAMRETMNVGRHAEHVTGRNLSDDWKRYSRECTNILWRGQWHPLSQNEPSWEEFRSDPMNTMLCWQSDAYSLAGGWLMLREDARMMVRGPYPKRT